MVWYSVKQRENFTFTFYKLIRCKHTAYGYKWYIPLPIVLYFLRMYSSLYLCKREDLLAKLF